MHLSQQVKPYKKEDGIHTPEEKLSKWQKFWLELGKFMGKGLAGRFEFNFKIKF